MPDDTIIPHLGKTHLLAIVDRAKPPRPGPPLVASRKMRRETMKIMFRAAIAALSFASIGPAFAGEGGQPRGGYVFPNYQFPKVQQAPSAASASKSGGYVFPDYQVPTTRAPSLATARSGHTIQAYVTSSSRGTWLSQPNQNEGANN
jgi:hypothetical protein